MRITFDRPATVTFDENTRTLTGLAVPYGPAGNGWTFAPGSLSWDLAAAASSASVAASRKLKLRPWAPMGGMIWPASPMRPTRR